MSDTCGHVKVTKLETGYGYGYASGWVGIGVTYRCPRCAECLWFDDAGSHDWEINQNTAKRKENLKWKPKKKTGPHKYKHVRIKFPDGLVEVLNEST
jgi:hypothetical protein